MTTINYYEVKLANERLEKMIRDVVVVLIEVKT
jgi:hypothetical protein